MAENYFENIRTIGANLDEGIAKLQETWEMPHLLLCKNNEDDQTSAKRLVEDLKNELNNLKKGVQEDKGTIACLRESYTQFLEETTRTIKSLKEEVDEIKILFAENGYEEDPVDDLSILNSQLEALSVSNNSFVKESDSMAETSMCENISFHNSFHNSPVNEINSLNLGTPNRNNISINMQKKSLINERPMEPMYSPYFYKMMKK